MRWESHPAANPSRALVIGARDACDVLVFMESVGGSPRRVRYCLKPLTRRLNAATATLLSLDEVMESQLNAPFGYNADTSERGKRNFASVIQWYFMGIVEPEVDFDYVEYCGRFYYALKRIEAEERAEKETEGPGQEECSGAQGQLSNYRGLSGKEAYTARQLEEKSLSINESHIQLALAEDTRKSLSSPTASISASLSNVQAEPLDGSENAIDAPELRGRKRTTKDAKLEAPARPRRVVEKSMERRGRQSKLYGSSRRRMDEGIGASLLLDTPMPAVRIRR